MDGSLRLEVVAFLLSSRTKDIFCYGTDAGVMMDLVTHMAMLASWGTSGIAHSAG